MEIERKFIFNDKFFNYDLNLIPHYEIEQYYLSFTPEIRLRKRVGEDTNCFITIKSVGGLSRNEFEEAIPIELFDRLKEKRVSKIISKTRFVLNLDGYSFEIDYYKDHLEGLKVVEIEFQSLSDSDCFNPNYSWISDEITENLKYKNSNLSKL